MLNSDVQVNGILIGVNYIHELLIIYFSCFAHYTSKQRNCDSFPTRGKNNMKMQNS